MNTERVTRQGVRDLNVTGYNGKRPDCEHYKNPELPTYVQFDISDIHAHKAADEMRRLVREAIIAAGGYVTAEGLVVVPNRPRGWQPMEWPTLIVVAAECVPANDKYYLAVKNDALRDKVSMFIANHMPGRANDPGGVLVLCPAE